MANKKPTIYFPHDGLFKNAMHDVRVAREVLEQYLPERLQKIIRLETLKPTDGNYIDDDLKRSQSDILYEVKTTKGKVYLYILCEQQTVADINMPLRLLEYSLRIMKDHAKKGYMKLPIVIPVVVYSGKKSPYPYSCDRLCCIISPQVSFPRKRESSN